LGQGKAKLLFLPEPHTDFVFSVVGEELGFLGALGLLFLFGLLIFRGGLAALRCKDPFGALLAAGLTSLLGLQTLFHLGVVVGLLPTKGLPLPFISTGGSALLVALVSVGILLSVAGRNRKSTGGDGSLYDSPPPGQSSHGKQHSFPRGVFGRPLGLGLGGEGLRRGWGP
jgi:cell division protein FtsW